MNKLVGIILAVGACVAAARADESAFDFNCSRARSMVRLMQRGPDVVINHAAADAVRYRDRTIPGWTCLMTPLPPMRDGRTYLESLDCYAKSDNSKPNDDDFAGAGEVFKNNLTPFNECFGNDLLGETPVSYTRTSRGEGIIAMLKNKYAGVPILVTYGYFWDSTTGQPIVWKTVVGYQRQ
jgi:hypothetical protein